MPVPSETDDFSLMQRIAAADADALAALFDRHGGLVYSIALRILRDRGDAEDLLTEVFWEIWNRAERYNPARGAPLTYLATLARSRSIDRRRSASSRGKNRDASLEATTFNEPPASGADPSADIIYQERRVQVREALRQLDPAQKQAVELAFLDGLSHTEIAERLDKPLGTVKTYIRQGLIRLRDFLRTDT